MLNGGFRFTVVNTPILRTEWLGWGAATCPDTVAHCQLYTEAVTGCHPHRANIRLFDIGGDKIPKWASNLGVAEHVHSPLGHRGIRSIDLLAESFQHQLKAVCKLARNGPIGIVVPMVTDVGDICIVKQRLAALDEEVLPNIQIGAMVEVPAAALNIGTILPQVDFVHIGPGDLTQFTLAKLRVNLEATELSGRSMHPAVLILIAKVAKACRKAGKPVSICLDIEPRTALLKALLSAGMRTFCVSPAHVLVTAQRLREACSCQE